MKKLNFSLKTRLSLAIGFIAFAGGALLMISLKSILPESTVIPIQNETPAQEEIVTMESLESFSAKIQVEQNIIFSVENKQSQNLDVVEGESVLAVLKQSQEVETKAYDFGELVESIGGIKNGTDDKFWTYKVNGEAALVGAADYKLKQGDKIEWKFGVYEGN